MKKSLSDRIADRAKRDKATRNAQNLAAFLAVKEDVAKAMADGWTGKAVYDTLRAEGKITVSYQAFLGYIRRVLRQASATPTPAQADPDTVVAAAAPPLSTPQQEAPKTKIASFSFQSTPDKEDLF